MRIVTEQVKFQMKFVYIEERKNGSVYKIVRSIVKIWIYVYIYIHARDDATPIFRRIYPGERERERERALSEIESGKLN